MCTELLLNSIMFLENSWRFGQLRNMLVSNIYCTFALYGEFYSPVLHLIGNASRLSRLF